MSMKIHSACGAKSTARNIYEIDGQINTIEASSSISSPHTQDNSEPKYIQLWNKTKRHANGKLNDEAELVLIEFEKLHQKELAEKGIDNLSIEEAYDIVLGHSCGYARGLGRAHPVMQKGGRTTMSQMLIELEQLRARELEMKAEMEQLRANAQKKEEEALERDAKREEEAREREDKICAEFKAEMAKVQDFMNHFLS